MEAFSHLVAGVAATLCAGWACTLTGAMTGAVVGLSAVTAAGNLLVVYLKNRRSGNA